MKVPLSWLKDYIDLDLPLDQIARTLTMIGLEVDEIHVVGLPMPATEGRQEFKTTGLSWDPDKIVVAAINEVAPHPNADRLVLCRLDDGQQEQIVLTGAPNLFPYKGQGALAEPLKVAYAKEGARIYDGHQPGQVLTTLKRAKIRGIDSYSMVCSEKELGVSDEHEGIIFLDADAPTGMPLADYMGDAVFDISILPNMIRNACVLGVARELSAALGLPLRKPSTVVKADGPSIADKVKIEIRDPELNPRFVFGLIEDVEIRPSPYVIQRRLRLAGMRPISNLVDATNYVMLEVGQPLHAFDYDKLRERAGGSTPTVITRTAYPGEHLTTLDSVDRALDPFTVMVTDTQGALSIAGVMGGEETEITDSTKTVIVEGAAWNFINIRKTVAAQRFQSEAAYRFSRGIHPALTEFGVKLCLNYIHAWSGGKIYQGLVDEYPLPAVDPVVELPPAEVTRILGIEIPADEMARLLANLEFEVSIKGEGKDAVVVAKAPPHRLDIGTGVVGQADLIEEIARHYGYINIPARRLCTELPPQRRNDANEGEEKIRDLCVAQGLQEVMTYRLTTPEREARLTLDNDASALGPYVRLQNPITPERAVMRRSVLASVLEVAERNNRLSERLALFELGKCFYPREGQVLPDEPAHLAVVLRGPAKSAEWDRPAGAQFDFYDLKGALENILEELHLPDVRFAAVGSDPFHPGKCAQVLIGDEPVGVFGELHPAIKARYDLGDAPVLAAELEVSKIIERIPRNPGTQPVPVYPPVLEDIAVVVDETVTAERLEAVIRQAGGKTVARIQLFDIFRGAQIGEGKKSMAYNLTYLAPDRTLTDKDTAQIRQRIIRRLEQELGAKLRA